MRPLKRDKSGRDGKHKLIIHKAYHSNSLLDWRIFMSNWYICGSKPVASVTVRLSVLNLIDWLVLTIEGLSCLDSVLTLNTAILTFAW